MKALNKVQFIGNLGGDPNVVTFENGGKKAEFTIATQDSYKDQAGAWQTLTDWHRVYATGKTAETVEKYFTKGMRVYVEGKLKTRSYTDKDGNTRYVTEVRMLDFMFLSSKGDGAVTSNTQGQPEQVQEPKQEPKQDDDLPF